MRLEAKGDSYMGEQAGEQTDPQMGEQTDPQMGGQTDPQTGAQTDPQAGAHGLPWLELGYHIFRPYRCLGYASEAAAAIQSYTHQVLEARLCRCV